MPLTPINTAKVPIRYVPNALAENDKTLQRKMLLKSRKLYRKGKYFTRRKLPSFSSIKSPHITHARKYYGVEHVVPNKQLAKATGCSISALQEIVKKGEGAYFSSGSRPNQTAQSWGYARLASAITAGKSAAVDYAIIEKGCRHDGKAFRLAQTARQKHGYGHRHTQRVIL